MLIKAKPKLYLKAAFSTGVFTSGLHPIGYRLNKAVSENRPERSEHAIRSVTGGGRFSLTPFAKNVYFL